MKNVLLLFCVFLVINVSFVSCGSDENDEDNEVYVTTQDQGKDMIKGQWSLQSTKMQSNYPDFDKQMNSGFTQTFKVANIVMKFQDTFVLTETEPKNKNNPIVYPTERDDYYFENNTLYIFDSTVRGFISYTFKVSEKSLLLTGELTRSSLVKMLEEAALLQGLDKSLVEGSVPTDFSGKLFFTLKK